MTRPYPEVDDPNFYKDIRDIDVFKKVSEELDKTMTEIYCYKEHQRYLANWFRPETPYKSMLLFHEVGSGKTLSSIAIAEASLSKNILVLTKNSGIIDTFMKNLRKGCEKYKVIPPKYVFKTYKQLENELQTFDVRKELRYKPLKLKENSVVIVDEAHNLTEDGGIYSILKESIKKSKNVKVILLSATPVFDKPEEILAYIPLLKKDVEPPLKLDEKYLEETIEKYFRGVVSYTTTPKRDIRSKKIIQIRSTPVGIQKEIIEQLEKSATKGISSILQKTAASMFVYPGGGFNVKENRGHWMDLDELDQHSIKLYNLLGILRKQGDKKIVVYSNFVRKSMGVKLIKMVIQHNFPELSIYSIDGENDNKIEIIKQFNKSKTGILVTSPVLSEGITLKEVDCLHIMEPHWNHSRITQVIGRVVRIGSHKDVSKSVDIYYHIMDRGIDPVKLYTANRKSAQIKKIENILKKISIDCHLQDQTECIGDVIEQDTVEKVLSLNIKTQNELLSKMKKKMKDLILFTSIDDFLQDFSVFGDRQDTLNMLRKLDLYKDNDSVYTVTDNFVVNARYPNVIGNSLSSLYLTPTSTVEPVSEHKSKSKPKTSGKKARKIQQTLVDEPIYATYTNKFGDTDNKFRIVDNSDVIDGNDKRKVNTGKVIDTYKKQELVDLMKKLGITTNKTKKNDIIPLIFMYFVENKLVF